MPLNGVIENRIAGGAWLLAGGVLVSWFERRRRQARQVLRQRGRASADRLQTDQTQSRLMFDAFLAAGTWLVLFAILDWLF